MTVVVHLAANREEEPDQAWPISQHARDCGYLTEEEHDRLTCLAIRCTRANSRLLQYLARCKPPDPFA